MIDRRYLALDALSQLIHGDYGISGENDANNALACGTIYYKESDFFSADEIRCLNENLENVVEEISSSQSGVPDDILFSYSLAVDSKMHVAYYVRAYLRGLLALPTMEEEIISMLVAAKTPGYGAFSDEEYKALEKYRTQLSSRLIAELPFSLLERLYRIKVLCNNFNDENIKNDILLQVPRRVYTVLKRTVSLCRMQYDD